MSTTATSVPIGTWQLDPVHSDVGFEVAYLVGKFKGHFNEVQAQLAVGGDGSASLAGSAKVASVDVKDENLAGHLQSPDFFDAERHPELGFAARELVLDGDHARVQGDLTIKGVTKPVELDGALSGPLTDAFGNERIGLELATTVNRHDYGVSWNIKLPTGKAALADDVKIRAELYFVKQV